MRDLTGLPRGPMLDARCAFTDGHAFGGSEQQYDVPLGAASLLVLATGAPGGAGDGGGAGGPGSRVRTILHVTAGQVLYVNVGAGGASASGQTGGSSPTGPYGGGGADGGSVSSGGVGGGGAGGGASSIRTCSLATLFCFVNAPLVVAAGGGGGGGGSGAGAGGAGDGSGSAGTGPRRRGAPARRPRAARPGSSVPTAVLWLAEPAPGERT